MTGTRAALLAGWLALGAPQAARAAPPPPPPARFDPPPVARFDPAPAARFDIVRITPHGRALIAGHAPPGARVVVFADGKRLGTATADGSGSWLLLPQARLPTGTAALHLSVRLLPAPTR